MEEMVRIQSIQETVESRWGETLDLYPERHLA